MDIASKIKLLKEEAQKKDDENTKKELQIKELNQLMEEMKKKDKKAEELQKKLEELAL